MKLSTLKGEVSVPAHIKKFALILAILEGMYFGDRNALIKRLAHFYGVTL